MPTTAAPKTRELKELTYTTRVKDGQFTVRVSLTGLDDCERMHARNAALRSPHTYKGASSRPWVDHESDQLVIPILWSQCGRPDPVEQLITALRLAVTHKRADNAPLVGKSIFDNMNASATLN